MSGDSVLVSLGLGSRNPYLRQKSQITCYAEQVWELMGCTADIQVVFIVVIIVLILLLLVTNTLNYHVPDTHLPVHVPVLYTYDLV